MNKKQLELYTHNLLLMNRTFQEVGGDAPYLLDKYIALLQVLSANGVRLRTEIESTGE